MHGNNAVDYYYFSFDGLFLRNFCVQSWQYNFSNGYLSSFSRIDYAIRSKYLFERIFLMFEFLMFDSVRLELGKFFIFFQDTMIHTMLIKVLSPSFFCNLSKKVRSEKNNIMDIRITNDPTIFTNCHPFFTLKSCFQLWLFLCVCGFFYHM